MRRGKGSASILAKLLRACRSFHAYHFWLACPWLTLAFLAACFAIQPR